jgi:tetratricopeptide (TPR) repeat protein
MSGRRILFYGNCQVQYIARVYAEQICPLNGDTARYLDINHTRFEQQNHRDAFTQADILVDQVFDVDDPIPPELIDPSKVRLRIPNMRGDFLWPFGTRERHPRHASFPAIHYYGHEYGDTFLNRMVLQNVPAEEAVHKYLDVDFTKQRNLPRILEISMDRQLRRDRISGISVCGFMLDNLRSEFLFFSSGHPSERLLHLVTRPVLKELVGEEMTERALAAQYLGFSYWRIAPVHPNVARALSLNFVSATTRYLVYDEGYFTFEEYALRYMRGETVAELPETIRRYGELDPSALLAAATRSLAKAPMSPLAHRFCSQAQRRLGQPGQAVEWALRALGLEPENQQNITDVIAAFMESNDLAAAERWARLAISKFPREASVYHSLCDVLARSKHADLGKFAALAAALQPGHVFGLLRAARHLLAAGEAGEAAALAGRAVALDPKSVEAAQLHTQILDSKRRNAVSARRQSEAKLHAQLAQLLMQDNDAAGAEGHYRQAIELDPWAASFHAGLAEALERQGRSEDSRAVLRAAPSQWP